MKENENQKILKIIMKYTKELTTTEALMFNRMLDEIEYKSKDRIEYAQNFMNETYAFFYIYRPDLYKKILEEIKEELL